MFIMSERGDRILNFDFAVDIYYIPYNDGAVIYVTVPSKEKALTLSRYKDIKEAKDALGQLFRALTASEPYFTMPPSRLYSEERIIKDARVKRKGGS